jgi:hypothetical protein
VIYYVVAHQKLNSNAIRNKIGEHNERESI